MKNFSVDPCIEKDSSFVINLDLCEIRLHHNAKFPWIILIPRQPRVFEIIDLSKTNMQLLIQEIALASKVMQKLYEPDKLNVANLGNVVPQLHVHVIARYKHDMAWPQPVWNSGVSGEYSHLDKEIELISATFEQLFQTLH